MTQLSFAEQNKWNEIKISKNSFYFDSTINKVGRDTLEKHLQVISLIVDSCRLINNQTLRKSNIDSIDSLVISKRDKNRIEYRDLNNRKFISATVDFNNTIRKIWFYPNGRGLTKEEIKSYFRTRKIPETFRNISEDEAIGIAKKFHRAIYGKKEDLKFDSIYVTISQKAYTVTLGIKQKNDIWDTRTSNITVNANTGEIEHFRGEGLSDIEFSYVPKVKKEQFLQIYKAVRDSLHAIIIVHEIGLTKHPNKNGENRLAWQIYGQREDKSLRLSAMFFVDSETGEVLLNALD
jgi:hypothetical protein